MGPKFWSFNFSISPSNEYSGLISFRIDWFDLLAVQGTQESSPAPQLKSINSLALSLLYSPTLTSVHDSWKVFCSIFVKGEARCGVSQGRWDPSSSQIVRPDFTSLSLSSSSVK